jgi:RNA 3'-terminal phosphate cyclase
LGESALGRKGVPAEALGEACAIDLADTIRSRATVDAHALDQVLPFMALAKGDSAVLAEELTGHAETNIWVIEKFLGKKFQTDEKERLVEIRTV